MQLEMHTLFMLMQLRSGIFVSLQRKLCSSFAKPRRQLFSFYGLIIGGGWYATRKTTATNNVKYTKNLWANFSLGKFH